MRTTSPNTCTSIFPEVDIVHRMTIHVGSQLCWCSLELYHAYPTTLRSMYSSEYCRKEQNYFIPNALLFSVMSNPG